MADTLAAVALLAAAFLAAVALLAAAFLAGYLTHRYRTRRTITQLAGQVDALLASLASIPPEAVEHRQAVLVDHERRRHQVVARIDAYYLGGAA